MKHGQSCVVELSAEATLREEDIEVTVTEQHHTLMQPRLFS